MQTPVETYLPAETYDDALARACHVWGVQEEFWDIFGARHVASLDIRRAILTSLGVPAGSTEDLNRAIEERSWREWSSLIDETSVMALSSGHISIQVPVELQAARVHAEFSWEDGGREVVERNIAELKDGGEALLRGHAFRRKLLPLPAGAVFGYHDVTISVEGLPSATGRLILCPDRAYMPGWLERGQKAAGIAVSLYGIRTNHNWGCGDFTDLKQFSDWVSDETGSAFIALNPLHSIPNRQPYNTSPYLPNCSFYGNPIYIDVTAVEDVRNSEWAQQCLSSRKVESTIRELRHSKYVEYEKVFALKKKFLKIGFRSFLREYRDNTARAEQFRSYIETEGDLLDKYAVYCALDEVMHKQNPDLWIWPDWPAEYNDPSSPAVSRFVREHWRLVLFYKYMQWQYDLQLAGAQEYVKRRGLSIGLYHDLALATDRCGSDLWAHGPFYIGGCRVGSPPDSFSPKGQDWAFPPPNSLRHRGNAYQMFADSIRKNCKHGGALRIDHVMRFFRLYWIPEGTDATHGVYVRDFSDDLLKILALESVRHKVVVIGEDLGTVEPYIREALAAYRVLSYRLLYFEKNKDGSFKLPEEYPRNSLVSVTTHDLPTLAGFWTNEDIEVRRKAGIITDNRDFREQIGNRSREKQLLLDLFHKLRLLPPGYEKRAERIPDFSGELHNAAVGFLALTPAMLMVLNQEDLFKDPEQQNLPGTTEQYPNWRHKMRYSVEELRRDPTAVGCTEMFRNWLMRTGRLNRVENA
ncbi:MAG TPA: 4-alpha-glucanotransferase [Bryobacteraceae bacterium]|nr:4-alpha-glucanotransferase [Bryobacteraceae bacterium]